MTTTPSGDLLHVATWWQEHSARRPRVVAWIQDPVDDDDATNAVHRAVDSGATLIALRASGDEVVARASVSLAAKVDAIAVRDQPADMSDLEWMRQVAMIRDARAGGDPSEHEPAIAAIAAALRTARDRATPVVFDGLIAHAGALVDGVFDPSWLPAASSTDPAIQVAQQVWKVKPALDLHLRADDDLGLRTVLAVLDVVQN